MEGYPIAVLIVCHDLTDFKFRIETEKDRQACTCDLFYVICYMLLYEVTEKERLVAANSGPDLGPNFDPNPST